MPRKKAGTRPAERIPSSAVAIPGRNARIPATEPPTVSARWLLTAVAIALVAAALCAWGALCLLFWQGSWQLLYHPASAVTRTPASVNLLFDPVGFATTETGEARLKGWWIPAAESATYSQFTVLYLHGQNGNLSDAVDAVATLHQVGLNIFAFDYRGYGQSQFARPSEAHWREDVESAIEYLVATRHIMPGTIILVGRDLGANLSIEIAAAHPDLAGVVLESPSPDPVSAFFKDPRAHLVPAHLLVRDRYDLNASAAALKIPSLWRLESAAGSQVVKQQQLGAYEKVAAPKMQVWLAASPKSKTDFANSLSRWLDDLHR